MSLEVWIWIEDEYRTNYLRGWTYHIQFVEFQMCSYPSKLSLHSPYSFPSWVLVIFFHREALCKIWKVEWKKSSLGLLAPGSSGHEHGRCVVLLMSGSLELWQVPTAMLWASLITCGTDQQPRTPSFGGGNNLWFYSKKESNLGNLMWHDESSKQGHFPPYCINHTQKSAKNPSNRCSGLK